MRFRPGARLDTSQVEDFRGRSGMPGGGLAVGGGGLGVAGIVIYLLFALLGGGGGGLGATLQPLDDVAVSPGTPASDIDQDCRTGADANNRQDCRIVGDVNSIQKYWSDWFRRRGKTYEPATTRFFTGSIDTGCGGATTDVGPFY